MYRKQGSRATDTSLQYINPMEDFLAQAITMQNEKIESKNKLQEDYFLAYKPASYQKALKFKNDHGYQVKQSSGEHRTLEFMEDNLVFTKFGPGIYLYLELFRRLGWLFFIMAIFQIFIAILNWKGTGLSEYSVSFGNLLIYSTLGNYNTQITGFDIYIQTGGHCLMNLVFFVFFIFWKIHNYEKIDEYENGDTVTHPRRFCVEVEGLPSRGVSNRDLEIFFSNFGPIYECSLVYNYKDKLRFFQEVDQIDQKIKQEELEIALGGGDMKDLQKLKHEKQELANKINSTKISPRILSVFVHFQYQKSKAAMLDFYQKHNMLSTTFHECCMHGCCCCCFDEMAEEYKFKGVAFKIKSAKVTDPEQINWQSFDVSTASRVWRILFASFIILVFLFICSTLVALCSIFITSNTVDCSGLGGLDLNTAQTTTDSKVKVCFCNSKLFDFLDSSIQTVCKQIFKTLYIQNLLQLVAAVVSTITNFIFGLILTKIINFTKPTNLSSALVTQTFVFFVFLVINSIVLPLLIYSDINGVKPASFVSLVQILFPNVTVFNMTSFQYYSDFTVLWYKNVSPYFTNFLIVDIIIVWGNFLWQVCYKNCSDSSLESDGGKIIQKKMNQKITDFQVDAVKETAHVFLIVFMCMFYSAGIPILVPFAALDIISRYISNKHLLIHHSKRIEGLTEDFNALSVLILPFATLFGCLFGIWMLTASSFIYPDKLNVQIPGTSEIQNKASVLPRMFYISFTLLLAAAVLVYILFWNIIVRFLSCAFSCCCSSHQTQIKVEPVRRKPVRFSDMTRTMNVLYSYNIHHNDKYKNAILNLERFLQIE